MYRVRAKSIGKLVSLFSIGLPKSLLLNEKTPQKALFILHELGIEDVVKEAKTKKNGSDNKK